MQGDTRLGFSEVVAKLASAIEAVERRIPISPASRVGRWRAAVERMEAAGGHAVLEELVQTLQTTGSADHPFRESFLALTESRHFIAIVENLLDHLEDEDLRELIKGSQDPASDGPSARARDKEFEKYIAAVLLLAGFPVALAEPDILVRLPTGTRSVAVKRLWSRKKLQRNLRVASKQIANSGHPGYIVIEVTRYLNPDMCFIDHERFEGQQIDPRMDRIAQGVRGMPRHNELVRGVFLRSAFPLISLGLKFGTAERWTGVAVEGGDKEEHRKLLSSLMSAFHHL
ncbi:MAG: hypothetical protein ACYC6F_17485 [Longimicrobiales bacterium]